MVTGASCDQCRPGAYHLSEKSPQGCLKCFCFGVTDQCRSSDWHRTKERLEFNNDAEGVVISDMEERNVEQTPQFQFLKTGYLTYQDSGSGSHTKYWRLPQRFLGDKVTAYGGKMEFELEFSGGGALVREPMVVLKGNQNILVHRIRNPDSVLRSDSPVRITVETYETNYEQLNGSPATREDLMMVLADLDAFLIRATHAQDQRSSSLGDVSWEIAVDRRTSDGLALEVEQCVCPPGYKGTSCEDCAPGYERSGQGPYLGTCVPVRQRPQQVCGSGAQPSSGQRCECKPLTTGPNCDQCAPRSFYMSPNNPQGCIPCFCSGVAEQCQSSNYQRKTVDINYHRGDRDQLALTSSDHRTLKFTFKYNGDGRNNQDPHVILRGNDITLQYTHREQTQSDRENTIEFKIFEDKFQRVDGQRATREHLLMALADLDTLLIKATYIDDCAQSSLLSVSLEYAEPYGGGPSALEVEQCVCPQGYIGTSCEDCAPGYARTGGGLYLGLCEKCECHGHANQCHKEYGHCLDCQHNTEGDRCERCKPGFVGDARRGTPNDCQPAATRAPCQCYNHSPRGCDSFGRCLLCEHNTEGMHCERCKKGYYGDATKGTPYDCQPCPCPGASECYLEADGQVVCRNCPAGFTGRLCNECAPGYTKSSNPSGRVCEPIGQIDPGQRTYIGGQANIQQAGQPLRVRIDDPKFQLVSPGRTIRWLCRVAGDLAETARLEWSKVGQTELPDRAHVHGGTLTIYDVQSGDEGQYRCTATTDRRCSSIGGQPPQPVVDPLHTVVDEGDSATVRCWVPGIPDCQITWHKEHIGGSLPHGAYQMGNALKIPRAEMKHAGRYICTAVNQYGIGQSPPAVIEVRRKPMEVKVDPITQTVNPGDPARIRCWVPGNPDAKLTWSRPGGAPLPNGVMQNRGILQIPKTTQAETGQYICTAEPPRGGPPMEGPPATINLRHPGAGPQIDPHTQTVEVDTPAQFRCWVPGNPQARLRWSRVDGRPLPRGAVDRDGFLKIDKTKLEDAGEYICHAADPATGQEQPSPVGTLHVKSPLSPQIDPKHQTVQEGTPSRIRCWVPGNPNAQLSFRRADGSELNSAAQQQSGTLSIPETQTSDEGQYICTATDPQTGQTADSEPGTIQVTKRIQVIVEPAEQTVPEGTPFSIRCHVPGHPKIPLSWRRADGSQLNPEAGNGRGASIQVTRALLTDAGDYICTAHPPGQRQVDSSPATVIVNPEEKPKPETKKDAPQITPPEQTVDEGDPVTVRCWVEGNPTAELSFVRSDDKPLPFGHAVSRGILSIPAATMDDAGSYVCIYHPKLHHPNDVDQAPPPQRTTPSILHVVAQGEPPRPVATPPLHQTKPGTEVRFHCDPHSSTPARIKWGYGDADSPLPEGVREEGDQLIVESASEELDGEFFCSATNDFGTGVSNPVKVEVTEEEIPPTARVEPRIWNGKPGEKHQFVCITTGSPTPEAKGDPDPEVEWLHDPGPERGDLPEDFKPITISEQIIKHPSIGLGNAGVYTCRAQNRFATVEKEIYIQVVEPHKIATISILGGASQWFDQGETGELVCAATGSSLVDRIEWVKVDDQLPTDVEEHNEPGVLHFNNFKKSYAGEYECRGYRNDQLIATAKVEVHATGDNTDVPKVTIDPPKVRVINKGESTVLKCNVEGEGNDVFWWRTVNKTDARIIGTEPDWLISNADEADGGTYYCTDEFSNFETNREITHVMVRHQSPNGAKEGAGFKWTQLRDGSVIRHGEKQTLEIRNADPDNDFGIYRCDVEDENSNTIESAYTAVTIGRGEGANNAVDNQFEEKSDATFNCPIYYVPGAKVEWTRDGGELPDNAHPNGNKIEIKDFDENSAGLYSCKVSTQDRVVEGYVNAQLFVPDTIIQVMLEVSNETVSVGDRAWIDCKVTGDPDAAITWSKEGSDELPSNTQVVGGRIQFTDVTEENSGVYHCTAKTKAGSLEARSALNVGPSSSKRKRKHSGRRNGDLPHTQLPIVTTVGDRVYLACNTQTKAKTAHWQKGESGQLPQGAQVVQGVLQLPHVTREDEGIYTCLVVDDGQTIQSHVELQVDDPVLNFRGGEPVELPPLTDEQLRNIDVVLTVNPAKNGMIFATARRKVDDSITADPSTLTAVTRWGAPVHIEHSASIKDDKVIYTYDIGNGKETLYSIDKLVPNEMNIIEIMNNDTTAAIKINNGTATVRPHLTPSIPAGENTPVYIGGSPPWHRSEDDSTIKSSAEEHPDTFQGVISVVAISGEPRPFDDVARPVQVEPFNACHKSPCLNGGRCRTTSNFVGYSCKCEDGFEGDQCQHRTPRCRDEDCNSGLCLENEDTWQCVCPADSSGLRCEIPLDKRRTALGFTYDTSFVSLKPVPRLDSVSIDIEPKATKSEHLLFYVASNYNPQDSKYVSLSLINDHVVFKQYNGIQATELKSTQIYPGRKHTVTLARTPEGETSFMVDGHAIRMLDNTTYKLGTELYIGGIPPGLETPDDIPEQPFQGCIHGIRVNGIPVNLQDTGSYKSGDIVDCSEVGVEPDSELTDRVTDGDEAAGRVTPDERENEDGGGDRTIPTILPEEQIDESIPLTTKITPIISWTTPWVTQEVPVIAPEIWTTSTEKLPEVIEPGEAEPVPETTPEPVATEMTTDEAEEEEEEEEEEAATTESEPEPRTTTLYVYDADKDKSLQDVEIYKVPITLRNETTAEKEEEEKAHILESVETEELEDIEDDDEEEEIELTTEKVVEEVKTVVESEADKSTLAPTPSPTEPVVEVAEVATTREISDEWNTIEDIDDVTPTMSVEDCRLKGTCPVEEICIGHTCGPNGICIPTNSTHYECQCKLYYDGPQCSIFKPVEHAAKFDGNAFIEISADEFPHLTSEKEETIEFKFKTTQANGIIMWQGQKPSVTAMEDYLYIGLVNGHLHYSYELGGGAAHIVTEDRVDDGKEHRVRLERRGRRGAMQLDGGIEQHARSSGILAMLNVDGNIFIGGVPNLYSSTGGLFSHNFVGCIADVTLNGEKLDLMGTAIDGKGVRPCDEWLVQKKFLKIRRHRHLN
ncbi:hypothetical protein WR25_06183 isoform C [Diploscapter pachys]|nr:hypothetical protein WR25_06183 isoform C [Diploscapter pachys]